MEQYCLSKTIAIAKATGHLLDPLDAAVNGFGGCICNPVNNCIYDAPKVVVDRVTESFHGCQPTPTHPANQLVPCVLRMSANGIFPKIGGRFFNGPSASRFKVLSSKFKKRPARSVVCPAAVSQPIVFGMFQNALAVFLHEFPVFTRSYFIKSLSEMGRNMKPIKANQLFPILHGVPYGGNIRIPHVHGNRLNSIPLLLRKTLKVGLQRRLLSVVKNFHHRVGLLVNQHRNVFMPLLEGRFIDSHGFHMTRFPSGKTSLHGSVTNRVRLIPTKVHQSRNRRNACFLQPVNHQRLEQRGKCALAIGPGHGNLFHPVGRAGYAWGLCFNDRSEVARRKVPPSLHPVIMNRARLLTIRAMKGGTWSMLDFHRYTVR